MNKLWLWFNNQSLRVKLITLFLITGLIPFGVAVYYALNQSSQVLEAQIVQATEGVRDARKLTVTTFFNDRVANTTTLADTIQGFGRRAKSSSKPCTISSNSASSSISPISIKQWRIPAKTRPQWTT